MRQRFIILGLFIAAISSLGGMWMQSEIAMAAPQEPWMDQTPQAICDGTSDMRAFLHSLGFTNDFRVMATLRVEAFSRQLPVTTFGSCPNAVVHPYATGFNDDRLGRWPLQSRGV